MVIQFYKKCLLGVLFIAPVGVSAEWSNVVADAAKDIAQGSLGWAAHAGLGYLAYRSYGALDSNYVGPVNIQKIAGYELTPDEVLTRAGTAFGVAALYHSAMFWQYCTFGVQLRKMKRPNTGTNLLFRNRWAECETAAELMERFKATDVATSDLKKQLLLNMGLSENTAPLEAIKKIDDALKKLYERLKNYESYTNIVELTAQRMIDEDSDTLALLGGDVLITDDIAVYAEDILTDYAQNSWIANSISIGLFFKEDCYLKRPCLYTSTYNIASRCAMKTLEQFARLKAVRHILEQYIPANQRQPHVIVHQHQR